MNSRTASRPLAVARDVERLGRQRPREHAAELLIVLTDADAHPQMMARAT